MNDLEPLFPKPPVRVAERPLVLTRRLPEDAWDEIVREARSGRRTAWVVAWVLVVICAAQAAAIALMLPLREVTPYTILVDRQTGYIETARGIKLGELAEDEAIIHSMAAQYVLARETFDPEDFAERYDRVTLWSAGTARQDYVDLIQARLPDSVVSDIRAGTRISITVKSIESLDADTVRVRFEGQRLEPGASEPARRDWQATLSYRFTGAPMRMGDRLLNPLGFQVTAYRRDGETPTDQSQPPAADAANADMTEVSPSGEPDAPPEGVSAEEGAVAPVASGGEVGQTSNGEQTETPAP